MVPRVQFDELKQQYDRLEEEYINLRHDINKLQEENSEMKQKLAKATFGYNTIRNNLSKLTFFTGLQNFQVFVWLLNVVKRSTKIVNAQLSLEDHLLIILIKVRLGLSNRDIAYRFLLSESTVSRVLREWVPVMARALSPLIHWPSKDAIIANMPKAFKPKFKNCRCIIDCSEIFIDRTYNLKARAETWSNYKHHNTTKYLVGITPAGAISFLSSGWGGRVSDKTITVESGFLNKLEPGDEILADRGFLVRDELAAVGATLRIPSFTKGKKQMSAQEVDTSRQLSRVRIHVERVIGRWKNYKILSSVIPISQVDLLDDIVIICGALTNLCGSVVNKK